MRCREVKFCWVLTCFIAAILLAPAAAVAWGCSSTSLLGSPCDSRELDFYVLYLRPTSTQMPLANGLNFETRDPFVTRGHGFRNQFNLGYRAETRQWWNCCCWYSGVSVTWFQGTHTETKTGVPRGDELKGFEAFGPAQPIFSATQHERARYLTADVEIGFRVAECGALKTRAFGGVRYLHLHVCSRADYSPELVSPNTTVFTRFDAQFRGVGPHIGLDFSWNIFRCVSFVARLGSSFLFANRPWQFHSFSTEIEWVSTTTNNRKHLTWALDGKLGLRIFAPMWKCAQFYVEGGMVLDHIVDGIQVFEGFPTSPGIPNNPNFIQRAIPFAIGGPYGRVGLCF